MGHLKTVNLEKDKYSILEQEEKSALWCQQEPQEHLCYQKKELNERAQSGIAKPHKWRMCLHHPHTVHFLNPPAPPVRQETLKSSTTLCRKGQILSHTQAYHPWLGLIMTLNHSFLQQSSPWSPQEQHHHKVRNEAILTLEPAATEQEMGRKIGKVQIGALHCLLQYFFLLLWHEILQCCSIRKC